MVEKINAENSATDPAQPRAITEVPVGENTLGFNFSIEDLPETGVERDAFESALNNIAAPNAKENPGGYEPEIDDEIGRFARQLDHQFRDYVEKVRVEERDRYETCSWVSYQ